MLNQTDVLVVPAHPLWLERNKRNLTQQMVADFTLLSVSTVVRAERGQAVRAYARQQLCEFFGKSAQELGLAFAGIKRHRAKVARLAAQGQPVSGATASC